MGKDTFCIDFVSPHPDARVIVYDLVSPPHKHTLLLDCAMPAVVQGHLATSRLLCVLIFLLFAY